MTEPFHKITGAAAWAKWKRQWFRRQRGLISSGPAFAYSHRYGQVIHKGKKP